MSNIEALNPTTFRITPFPVDRDPGVELDRREVPILRCRWCRAYTDGYIQVSPVGRWSCVFCHKVHFMEDEGEVERPELELVSFELLVPKEYSRKPPQPVNVVFLVDAALRDSAQDALIRLFSDPETIPLGRIGIVVFGASIQVMTFGNGGTWLTNPGEDELSTDNVFPVASTVADQILEMSWAENIGDNTTFNDSLEIVRSMTVPHTCQVTVLHSGNRDPQLAREAGLVYLACATLVNFWLSLFLKLAFLIYFFIPSFDFGGIFKAWEMDTSASFLPWFMTQTRMAITFDLFLVDADLETRGQLEVLAAGSGGYVRTDFHDTDLVSQVCESITSVVATEVVVRTRFSRRTRLREIVGSFYPVASDAAMIPVMKQGQFLDFHTQEPIPGCGLSQVAVLYTALDGSRRTHSSTWIGV